jgi:hypothetical protein
MIRVLLFAGLLAAAAMPAVAQVVVDAAQDGLVARLAMADTPSLAWRFETALPVQLDNIVATYNGRNVPIANVRTYPQAGETTSALIILDNTGGDATPHADVVRTLRARAALVYQSWTEQRALALASTGSGLQVVLPEPDVPFSPVEALVGLGFGDAPSDLHAVISEAVTQMGANPEATRRTIFLFTDGYSDSPLDYAALTSAARGAGVSVNVIVEPSREADLPALETFAKSTGGFYVAGTNARPMLANPFFYVDSGATAEILLANERRYLWDEQYDLSVAFNYGDKRLVLSSPATVQEATAAETVSFVWDNHGRTLGLVLAGAGWTVALVLMPFARLGRRTKVVKVPKPAEPVVAAPAAATAEKPERPMSQTAVPKGSGIHFVLIEPASDYRAEVELDADRITLGRARDNSIVIPNETVSGHHAVIVRSDQGTLNLTNLSETNPTQVNGTATQFATVRSGDEIGLGTVRVKITIGGK